MNLWSTAILTTRVGALIAFGLWAFPHMHGGLHITEFLADNGGSQLDSDGDASDWIEIFNSGPDTVDLDGFHLTDEKEALTLWRFPAVQLPAGGFLIVYASGKNRSVAGSELHTNFNLAKDGEYLALVAQDGITVITEFGTPQSPLPAQFEDVSYGLMQTGNTKPAILIRSEASARAFVPKNEALGTTWTETGFDDSGWKKVATGVGYDESSTYIPEFGADGNLGDILNSVNTSLYLRIPFELANAASISELTLKMKYDDGFAAFLNGVRVAGANAPSTTLWNSDATGSHADGEATIFKSFDITDHAQLLTDGANVLAIQGLNTSITSSDMLISPELHVVRITNPTIGGPGFLGTPSPATFNGDTFDGFVSDTKFSVNRGFYDSPFDVKITTETADAEIRYTIDGTTPTRNRGQIYTGQIKISGTTIVRAMAHRAGFKPTNIDTHTYLFPKDVVSQPKMRTTITKSGTYGPKMIASLNAVPTISLVTSNTSFLNEGGRNIREEYPASIEMIFPDGTPGFQENGGLSNYGGRYTNFRKKSFRVAFRKKFGVPKLEYPIFDSFHYKHFPPAREFDAINLRSGSHDMRSRGAYMSNRFADDSMLDMGNIAPHGRFVHVYLNGHYWGQYHLRERWCADMASSYFGGPEENYEAVNANDNFRNDEEVYDGSGQFWSETKRLLAGADPFTRAAEHIDIANIVDFMLLWVSGNSESEFRAFGSSVQGVPFKFMMKDADGFLRNPGHSASHAGPYSVMSRMRSGANGKEYSILLADRIHKHFFNNGALTPARNIDRLKRRVDEAQLGFLSEAARWGNLFREPASWESYQNSLINNHFPGLTKSMISRFKSAGMYSETVAPVFSQHGGTVSPDTPVTLATDADTLYYTLNGSDPRLPGGTPNPAARTASFEDGGPDPVTFLSTGHTWKYRDDGSDQGTAWRAQDFDDSGWQSGPSELGYGDDGEGSGTVVDFGPDSSAKFPTTYFRTTVTIPDPSAFFNYLLRVKFDDGIAIYINGVETIRQNLSEMATYSSFANGAVGDEANWKDFTLPSLELVPGLIAYWPLDTAATIFDKVAGIRGEVIGTAADAEGVIGGAVNLGEASNWIRIDANRPAKWLAPASKANAMSVSLWQKLNVVRNSSTFWFRAEAAGSNARNFQAHIPWGNNSIFFDTAGCCGGTQRINKGAGGIDFLEWHHFVFIKNEDHKEIWIDGELWHEGTNSGTLFDDWTYLAIGSSGTGDYAAAIVDDFGVWARAITPEEIAAIYNNGNGSPLMTDVLSAGTNTIAVEIHQTNASSSDIRFDMMLRGETSHVADNNVSDPVFFNEPAALKARSLDTGTGEWSALTEAFFSLEGAKANASKLVISELHYHPANPDTPAELAASRDRDDFEFLELQNISDGSLDLTGVRFETGINFAFPDHTLLMAGKHLLLMRNRSAFEARYGPIEGIQSFEYTGRLSNGGEQLILTSEGLNLIHDFTYNDEPPWPSEADGNGASLVLAKPAAGKPHGLPDNWTASIQFGGSPGAAEPTALTYAAWAASSGAQGEPGDDDDQDGLSNFWEFLFGSRPDLASDAPEFLLTIQHTDVDGQADDYLFLTFRRNLLADASLTVEMSHNLIHWTADPNMIKPVAQTDNGDGTATVTHRFARPIDQGQHRTFFRLRAR
ncbi:MAG: lamin tail domain-containing protein [Verrucomicrobiota bacterium]|nr:lamin tail domain-containing protein [Verrucomicrobiota bacterium]